MTWLELLQDCMTEGYLGLFLSSFLAATILPFSSEVVLFGMDVSGRFNTAGLFAVASFGNILGSVVNWALGHYFLHWQDRKWFPIKPKELDRASRIFNRYGLWSLLFAWVPIVGDPLTLFAGVLKTRFWIFLPLVAIGKAGRYAVLLGLIDWLR